MNDSAHITSLRDRAADEFQALLQAMTDDTGVLTLESVMECAARTIRGADHAAVSLAQHGRKPITVYSTGDLPIRVDALQYSLDEGPCVAALNENDIVLSNDLASDADFPRFAPGAVDLGVRSMLSTRLLLSADDRAALNLYAEKGQAFRAADLPMAAIFGSYVSLLLLNRMQREELAGLRRALESNRHIGVTTGILMAQQRITSEQAFEQLISASQHLNRRLRDVADEVNLTGELPGGRAPGRG